MQMPSIVVLLLESIGEWFDEASNTFFKPVSVLPVSIERFDFSENFLQRVADFFQQANFHGNTKLDFISPKRTKLGLPLPAIYPITMNSNRYLECKNKYKLILKLIFKPINGGRLLQIGIKTFFAHPGYNNFLKFHFKRFIKTKDMNIK